MPEWVIKHAGGYAIIPAQNDNEAERVFRERHPNVKVLSSELETDTMRIFRKMRERKQRGS